MTGASGFRLDLHNHTAHSSDGLLSPAALLQAAGLRHTHCIAVTDHNSVRGGLEAERIAREDPSLPRVIPGAEISSAVGEVIGLYLQEDVPRGLSLASTVEQIRRQGGVVYLPHPFDRVRRGSIAPRERVHAAELADIVEVVNGRSLGQGMTEKAGVLARSLRKPAGAGSDAHRAAEVGRAWVVVDELPTRETLVRLVGEGRVEHHLGSRDYALNWGFQGFSHVTRLRHRLSSLF